MSSFASVHFVAWGFGLGWREVVIKKTIVQPSELHKSSLKYSSLWPQKTSGYYILVWTFWGHIVRKTNKCAIYTIRNG